MKNIAENLSSTVSQVFGGSLFAMVDYSSGSFQSATQYSSSQGGNMPLKKFKRFFKPSRYFILAILGVVVIVLGGIAVNNVMHNGQQPSSTSTLGTSTPNAKVTPIVVEKPLATETLNKSFEFPLKDSKGKTVSKIQYEIQSAELDSQIIVQGQVATAVQGRVFLVLNLKITNNYDKAVQLNTRNYIRLIVNDSNSKLAADIHNDPVDVEAISTKFTRLGFPIDSNFKSLKLEVGQITGTKQTIALHLKN